MLNEGTERPLSLTLRVILGVIGAIAIVGGVAVIVHTLRELTMAADGPTLVRVVAIAVAALATVGGAQLLRGSMRGRILHRRNAPPPGVR